MTHNSEPHFFRMIPELLAYYAERMVGWRHGPGQAVTTASMETGDMHADHSLGSTPSSIAEACATADSDHHAHGGPPDKLEPGRTHWPAPPNPESICAPHVPSLKVKDRDVGVLIQFQYAHDEPAHRVVHDSKLLEFERAAEIRGDEDMASYACYLRLAVIRAKSRLGLFSGAAKRKGGLRGLTLQCFPEAADITLEYESMKAGLIRLRDTQPDIEQFTLGVFQPPPRPARPPGTVIIM